MNKWQIICPLVAIALVVIVFTAIRGRAHRAYYIQAHTRMIGEDLIARTNSSHLVQIGPGLRKRLSDFLAFPSGVADVQLGDEPSPIGGGAACSRLVVSNVTGGRLGIRFRQDSAPERFHVLGFWTITEPVSGGHR
jgi:hypothetical protein